MNPEIQKELLSWLQALKSAIETGAAFAAKEIPQVLWEKILLDRVYFTVIILIAIVALFAISKLVKLFASAINVANKCPVGQEGSAVAQVFVSGIGGLICAIFSFVVLINNFYPFLQVWFAPRLYLIEWVRELVK